MEDPQLRLPDAEDIYLVQRDVQFSVSKGQGSGVIVDVVKS